MTERWIESGVAGRPMYLGDPTGDTHVECIDDQRAVIAVLDGRGHGAEAAEASTKLAALIRESPWRPVEEILAEAEVALRGGRGSAIAFAHLDRLSGQLGWVGVGNVVAVSRTRGAPVVRMPLTPGCAVGFHLGEPVTQTIPFSVGDVLIFATDGIDPRFVDAVEPWGAPAEVARSILAAWRKKTDDAHVLVARRVR